MLKIAAAAVLSLTMLPLPQINASPPEDELGVTAYTAGELPKALLKENFMGRDDGTGTFVPTKQNTPPDGLKKGDKIWIGIAMDDFENFERIRTEGLYNVELAVDYDPNYVSPCTSNGETLADVDNNTISESDFTKAWLDNISAANFQDGIGEKDLVKWDSKTYTFFEGCTPRTKPNNNPRGTNPLQTDSNMANLSMMYIDIGRIDNAAGASRFCGIDNNTAAENEYYLVVLPFTVMSDTQPLNTYFALTLNPQTFVMGFGDGTIADTRGTLSYAAWEDDPDNPQRAEINLQTYLTFEGDLDFLGIQSVDDNIFHIRLEYKVPPPVDPDATPIPEGEPTPEPEVHMIDLYREIDLDEDGKPTLSNKIVPCAATPTPVPTEVPAPTDEPDPEAPEPLPTETPVPTPYPATLQEAFDGWDGTEFERDFPTVPTPIEGMIDDVITEIAPPEDQAERVAYGIIPPEATDLRLFVVKLTADENCTVQFDDDWNGQSAMTSDNDIEMTGYLDEEVKITNDEDSGHEDGFVPSGCQLVDDEGEDTLKLYSLKNTELPLTDTTKNGIMDPQMVDMATNRVPYNNRILVNFSNSDGTIKDSIEIRLMNLHEPEIRLNYGNSPVGLIWRDDEKFPTEADKEAAKEEFCQKNRFNDDILPEGGETKPIYTLNAWSGAAEGETIDVRSENYNMDRNKYAEFNFYYEPGYDPGIMQIINSLGRDVTNDEDTVIMRSLEFKVMDNAISNLPERFQQATDEGFEETVQMTDYEHLVRGVQSKRTLPGTYILKYEYKDDFGEKTAERPFAILPKIGDVTLDSIANNTDAISIKNQGKNPFPNYRTAGAEKNGALFFYRAADATYDAVSNNTDSNTIKNKNKAPASTYALVEYYKRDY